MTFEKAHQLFIQDHLERRTGERLRRLKEGHGYLEKLFLQNVWWPAIGHFRYLHPEYEVIDFLDGSRYLDFAYLRPPYRILFEADGYNTHVKVDRWQHGDNLMRQNHLVLDKWLIFRFSSDDITHKFRRCQQFVLHMIGSLYGDMQEPARLSFREREIVRFVTMSEHPVTPKELASYLGIHPENARNWLRRLAEKKLIKGASGSERIRAYVLDSAGRKLTF